MGLVGNVKPITKGEKMTKQQAIQVAKDVYKNKGIEMYVIYCPWDDVDGPYSPCDEWELVVWHSARNEDIVYCTSEWEV